MKQDSKKIQRLTAELLQALGENPKRDGLIKTPERVAESWKHLTKGYNEDISAILKEAIFKGNFKDMVLVKDIEFFSLCEHHLLPFFGRCHIAYIPKGKIVGLSKVARIVEAVSRRLQVQERMTQQLADGFNQTLKPKGVAVIVQAYHSCMAMRGVEKRQANVITRAMRGAFEKDDDLREELLQSISGNRQNFGF